MTAAHADPGSPALAQMSEREREIDPQLPERGAPRGAGEPLEAGPAAAPAAVGAATTALLDGDRPDAIWGPLRTSTLDLRWNGDADAVGEVLDAWIEGVAPALGEPGDWETGLALRVPSRDSALVRPLIARGFAAVGVTGIRIAGRQVDGAAVSARLERAGIALRRAELSDAPLLGEMDAELLAHDAQHGVLEPRPGAARILQAGIERRLAIDPEWTWVIAQRGEPVGYLSIEVDRERQRAECAPGGGVAYIQAMYLRPTVRGGGIGEAVVDFAHGRIADAGYDRVLLGYAALNPRSGPFWCRMGYRPLWTEWQRRPAVPAR